MIGAVVLAVALPSLQQTNPPAANVEASATPSATPTETASATAQVGTETLPPTPKPTPTGTPAPLPSEPTAQSVEVKTPSPKPAATPIPTPDPAMWRIEGTVVDEAGSPLEAVCVVVGPRGCQPYSPHTDENGHYFLDVAHSAITTSFDFYFEMPGYKTVWWNMAPNGPTVFNVVLRKG
ncbi:MAG: carboxypeptidase regulatory-like domain-containing protein [Chloroflexi bacterium]|nr:MAG: carboxypeptidase regulatory-like domain-containing protein [Chloroflexota bacterium]